jgi:transglycosylase-like protein
MSTRHRAPKHRRPTQNKGTAAVTGSVAGAVIVVSGALPASAASTSILEKIKQCESGGNYRAVNPSSRASGAYQFLDSTWRALPASRGYVKASHAPPAVQDRAARQLFAQAGTRPWTASASCWSGNTTGGVGAAGQVASRTGVRGISERGTRHHVTHRPPHVKPRAIQRRPLQHSHYEPRHVRRVAYQHHDSHIRHYAPTHVGHVEVQHGSAQRGVYQPRHARHGKHAHVGRNWTSRRHVTYRPGHVKPPTNQRQAPQHRDYEARHVRHLRHLRHVDVQHWHSPGREYQPRHAKHGKHAHAGGARSSRHDLTYKPRHLKHEAVGQWNPNRREYQPRHAKPGRHCRHGLPHHEWPRAA